MPAARRRRRVGPERPGADAVLGRHAHEQHHRRRHARRPRRRRSDLAAARRRRPARTQDHGLPLEQRVRSRTSARHSTTGCKPNGRSRINPSIAISPFEQIEREVIIVPELATNSLIVSATPRFYNEVIKVIKDLDERPPMVLIQVMIAEVRLNDTDEFGVELGLQDSVLFDRSLLSDVQTLTTTTTNQVQRHRRYDRNAEHHQRQRPARLQLQQRTCRSATISARPLCSGAANVATQGLSNFAVNRVEQRPRLRRLRVLGLEQRREHVAAGIAGKTPAGSAQPPAVHGSRWTARLRASRPERAAHPGHEHRHARRPNELRSPTKRSA